MKAVDFAVSRILPEDMRQADYDLSKKGMANIMAQVASKYPDRFGEIAQKLGNLGRNAAWYQGYTTSGADTRPIIDTSRYYAQMDAELDDLRKQKLDKDEFGDQRNEIYMKYSDMIEKDTMRAALSGGNNFARAVASGARGNAAHVKAILSTPGIYSDSKGRTIPLFVRNSFAGGLRPAEVLAGTYGARSAVVSTKKCLREGTLVRMADGSAKPIQALKVGDMVVGSDTLGVTTPVKVTAVFNQGRQAVWEYTLRFSNSNLDATTVECTEDHKMLMSDTAAYGRGRSQYGRGNGPAPDPSLQHARGVLPISKLGMSRRRAALADGGNWQCGISEPWAALLGLMLGDGCMTRSDNTFSCADELMIEHITPMLTSLGLKIKKTSLDPQLYAYAITTAGYHPSMNATSQKGTQGFHSTGRVPLNATTEAHGMRGKYSWEKELPPNIWSWDDQSIVKLIAAYFACDGSVFSTTNPRGRKQVSVTMASTSRALVAGIKALLSVRFGIHCGNIDERTKGGFGNEGIGELRKHPLYSICIGRVECVRKFAALLGDHVPGVKRERLARLAHGQKLTQQNTYAKMSLVGKRYIGELPCWDIAVDHPDHLFLLENGLIVSNSTAKGGDLLKIMTQGTLNYNVTEKDCGVENGIDLPSDDDSLTGRVLASAAGDLPAGTVIDRQALARLRKTGKQVMVRSAMTCNAAHGLCSKCVGVQADGYFPKIGESVGVTASAAIGEPIVQGALNTKHNCLYINDLEILSADGRLLSFNNLRVGDSVIGVGETARTITRVTAKIDQGIQPVYRYEFAMPRGRRSKLSISASAEHQVWTTRGKIPIGDADHILLPRAYQQVDGRREPYAFFAGFFMGDGIRLTPGNKQSLRVSCAELDTAEALNSYLKLHAMSLRKRKRSHDWAVVQTGADVSPRDPITGRIVSSEKHPMKALIRRLGWEGGYALTKSVPDEVWTWDDASVRDFIAGFVTADGSVYEYANGGMGIAMSSTSLPMLERLQQLLWSRLGVMTPCITVIGKVKDGGIRRNCQYQFVVRDTNEAALLAQQITPMGPKRAKIIKMRETLPLPNHAPVVAKLRCATFLGNLPCVDISVDADNELFSLSNGAVVKNSGMAKGKKSFSGFNYISQFVQIPDEFKDKAAVSEHDGMVENIEDAPQGGKFITVNGERHFALPGFEPSVKVGDVVEAGDQLSDGLVNPADIVRLRGLGEGRRYYAERLGQILTDSGNPPDKRNVEILARSAVDNYLIDDPDEDSPWQPDETVRGSDFTRGYTPPKDTSDTHLSKSVGAYLQKPTLHYTIGTRLTPKMIDRLQTAGIESVSTSRTEPWFKPEMKRLRTAAHDSKDWLVSMGTSYLSSQMRDALERGDETNVQENYHFGPRLAYGADAGKGAFGEHVEQTGKF